MGIVGSQTMLQGRGEGSGLPPAAGKETTKNQQKQPPKKKKWLFTNENLVVRRG